MRAHIVGIGGIGTSGLAQFLVAKGWHVTGSNRGETEGTAICSQAGIEYSAVHDAALVTSEIDVLIYSEAVPENNPERVRARKLNISEKSYFQVLGELTPDHRTVAVVGTHGKTTTVGLLTAGLLAAGQSPKVLMGAANAVLSGGNFHKGSDETLIVEACEYRENFRWMQPEIVVLTDIELDHTDYYRDIDHYLTAMRNVVHKAKTVVCHAEKPFVKELLEGFSGQVVHTDKTPFKLKIPGEYNQENARLAVCVGQLLGADEAAFQSGLEGYSGGSRRQQYLGKWQGLHVYDDYGHHPTEITLTAAAIKEMHPRARLGLVFEPHQHARTKAFFGAFVKALEAQDAVALWPIYAARDTAEDKKFTIKQFQNEHPTWPVLTTVEAVKQWAKETLGAGDVLLFMGAGVIDQVARGVICD